MSFFDDLDLFGFFNDLDLLSFFDDLDLFFAPSGDVPTVHACERWPDATAPPFPTRR